MKSRIFCSALLSASVLLSACATHPNKISAAYVSPVKYQTYDCQQVGLEQSNIEQRTNVLYHRLKGRNNSDKWMMGIGLVVAWPALLFMKGNNGAENTEFAHLKGEYEALRQTSIQKRCQLNFANDLAATVKKDAPKGGVATTAAAPAAAPAADPVANTETAPSGNQ
jgi:hypothetical protein